MYGSTKGCVKLLKACFLMVVLAVCPINTAESDNNANPTGGMRQLQYALVAGEANWVLQVIRSAVL